MVTDQPHQPDNPISSPDGSNPLNDGILRNAYARLDQYDQAAVKDKGWNTTLRAVVLLLGFIATLLSVALSVGGVLGGYINWFNLEGGLRLILFLLPLIGAGILAYITQPMPNMTWVHYRFSAEMIRRAIYQYRMEAGEYADLSLDKRQDALQNAIKEADNYSGGSVDLLGPPRKYTPDQFAQALRDSFTEPPSLSRWSSLGGALKAVDTSQIQPEPYPTFADYYEHRYESQLNWYTGRAFKDFRYARRLLVAGLIVGVCGSLLSFLNNNNWVAVTTAAAVTISSLAVLKMNGRTYGVYLTAIQELRGLRTKWETQKNLNWSGQAECRKLIADTEAIFKKEIDTWVKIAEQTLNQADSSTAGEQPPETVQVTHTVTDQTTEIHKEQIVVSQNDTGQPTTPLGNGASNNAPQNQEESGDAHPENSVQPDQLDQPQGNADSNGIAGG